MDIQSPKIWQTLLCWRKWRRTTVITWPISLLQRNRIAQRLQTCKKKSLTSHYNSDKQTWSFAEVQSSITTLTSKLAKTVTRPNCSTTIPPGPSDVSTIEKDGYCWSHVFKVTKGHNTSTCEKQKNGHMTAATKDNTMDGVLLNKDWDKWRRVCDKLVDNNINIIGTTNTITHKYVDNIAEADSGTPGHF